MSPVLDTKQELEQFIELNSAALSNKKVTPMKKLKHRKIKQKQIIELGGAGAVITQGLNAINSNQNSEPTSGTKILEKQNSQQLINRSSQKIIEQT